MNYKIVNMITLIKDSPELFHDGIDEEIIDLLEEIVLYIKELGNER